MRDIKFRAWNPNYKKMKEVFGLELKGNEVFGKRVFLDDNLMSWWQFKHCELLQYTGIHDNTEEEKEIYEGDKINFMYKGIEYVAEVRFEGGTFILCNEYLPDSYIPLFEILNSDRDYWWVEGEIVGNIYENKE